MVTEGRTVDHRPMPNRALVANRERRISIHVQCAVILDIRPATNNNGRNISTYHSVVPDASSLANSDVTYHHRSRSNENILSNSGPNALVRQDRHSFHHLICNRRIFWRDLIVPQGLMLKPLGKVQPCHPERSEGSRCRSRQTLRCAQGDTE